MDVCKWEYGKFYPCSGFEPVVDNYNEIIIDKHRPVCCIYCDTNISKPEPEEPIIKKSGETWVARYEGVDYLWINLNLSPEKREWTAPEIKESLGWKPILGIEIADKIVKLNPAVITDAYGLSLLLAMSRNEIFIVDCIEDGEWGCRTTAPMHSLKRLATIDDLP